MYSYERRFEMVMMDWTGLGGSMISWWPALLALSAMMLVLMLAVYVYFAWALMVIAKKLKYKRAWLAWIPFANIAMVLQLGGFHWAWVFLVLIPFAGWLAVYVLWLIATWRIFEKRKYPGWLSLVPILTMVPYLSMLASIAYLIIIGFVAWKRM